MMDKAWIVVCDRCPRYLSFPTTKPPDNMTDPEQLYRNREQLPAEDVDEKEILTELAKLGWSVIEGEICPKCRAREQKA
jgi:hypothetical protein